MLFKPKAKFALLALFFNLIYSSEQVDAQDGPRLPTAMPVLPRYEVVPQEEQKTSLRDNGHEVAGWHFGERYPRPFFYPFKTAGIESTTRMGHPGAPNHDHHRSIWFAHHDVNGIDFWTEQTKARIRQTQWYAYQDGGNEAVMATALSWQDENQHELMQQDLVAACRSLENGDASLEIQISFRPGAKAGTVNLGKTNFGFLAVRVAKSISAHFGDGMLSDSEGRQGEKAIFGKKARWVDYSGHVAAARGKKRQAVPVGITYFDHPDNPRYPTHWHVRDDGWMGASFCYAEAFRITQEKPLTLRYLLQIHQGSYNAEQATIWQQRFAESPGFSIHKSKKKHQQYEVTRN